MPEPYTQDALLQRVRTIYSDYSKLKQALKDGADDVTSRNQIRENAEALLDVASAILDKKRGIKASDPTSVKASEAVTEDQLNFIGQNMAPPQPGADTDRPTLDAFFSNVATSLVLAQQRLNQASLAYSNDVEAQFRGFIPPAQFLIPKVEATMQVGVSEMTGKSVNLVFFNDQSRKEQFSQNTIKFELVASPPPPGGLTTLTPFLVLEGKDALLARVLRELPTVAAAVTMQDTLSFSVVLQLPVGENKPRRYLAIYLIQESKSAILNPEWKALVMFGFADDGKKLTLLTDLLETGDSIIQLSTKTEIRSRTKADLTGTVLDLGDVIMNVVAVLYQWLASLGGKAETEQ